MTTPDPRRWWTLVVLCMSLMVIGVDNTILNVALPTLVRDLHASTSDLQWIVDAYVLVFAGLLLTAGALGDRFGRRRTLTIGLMIFGSASAAAAFSSGSTELIAFRALMGIGAALIMPATLSILTNVFTDPKERGRAIGVWAGVSAIGVAIGPIGGGLLLQHFWWGSVFLVNVPIVVGALVLGRFFIPESKDPKERKLDPVGAVLSMIAMSSLLWAIIEGPTNGWGSATTIAAFGAGLVVLVLFALWERRSDEPMLDVTFFRNPRFTIASLSITLAFFAVSGMLFLVSQLLQFAQQYDALGAGLRIAPIAIVLGLCAPLSPRLVERIGTKRTVTLGLLVTGAGLIGLSQATADSGYGVVLAGLIGISGGMSMVMAPATESIMGSLPRARAGVGSAVNDTTRQAGGALGVAIMGSVLVSGYHSYLDGHGAALGVSRATLATARTGVGAAINVGHRLGGRAGDALVATARDAFVHGMSISMLIGAAVVLGGAVLAFRMLPARAPHHDMNATEYLPTDIMVDPSEFELEPAGVEGTSS